MKTPSWRIVAQAIEAAIEAGIRDSQRNFIIGSVYDMANLADKGATAAPLVELYMFVLAIAEEHVAGPISFNDENAERLREILAKIKGGK